MQKKSKSKKSKKIKKVKPKIREIPKIETLEQEIEEQPEFTEEQFHEFLRPSTETTTPVLERIETPQEPMNLEENIGTISSPTTDEKQDEAIKYKTISEDYEAIAAQSRKMQDEELVFHQPLQTARLEEQRIHLRDMSEQKFEFNPELQEMRRRQEGDLERDYVTKVRGDFKEEKTHSPIEQQERKYKIK